MSSRDDADAASMGFRSSGEVSEWQRTQQKADSAQPVVADTLTDAEVLEYCDTHPEATFAQAVLALASTPRAIPAEQAAPAFYVRDSDVEALKDQRIAGRGAMLHKEAGEGRTAYYAAMGTPAAAEPGKGE